MYPKAIRSYTEMAALPLNTKVALIETTILFSGFDSEGHPGLYDAPNSPQLDYMHSNWEDVCLASNDGAVFLVLDHAGD